MKQKIAYVSLVLAAVLFFSGCASSNKNASPPTQKEPAAQVKVDTPSPAIQPEAKPIVQLSEQPNIDEFNKYFSEISLGKMPIGSKKISPPDNVPTKTDVFSRTTDQFCVAMTMVKDIPLNIVSVGAYDVIAKKFTTSDPKSKFPRALTQGGSIGCESLEFPIGKYEYKTYVNDIPVSVIPFEVK